MKLKLLMRVIIAVSLKVAVDTVAVMLGARFEELHYFAGSGFREVLSATTPVTRCGFALIATESSRLGVESLDKAATTNVRLRASNRQALDRRLPSSPKYLCKSQP